MLVVRQCIEVSTFSCLKRTYFPREYGDFIIISAWVIVLRNPEQRGKEEQHEKEWDQKALRHRLTNQYDQM